MQSTPSLSVTSFRPVDIDYSENTSDRPPPAVEIARKRLLPKSESPLAGIANRTGVSLATDTLAGVPAKVQSSVSKIWSYTWNTRGGVWVGTKAAKAIRTGLICRSGTKKEIKKHDQMIFELSGSEHLSEAIHSISPVLTPFLKQKLLEVNWWEWTRGSFNSFFPNENGSLTIFIDGLLSKMYINIATNIRESMNANNGGLNRYVSIADVMACIYQIIATHLPRINAHIDTIQKNPDASKRDANLLQLFLPLVDDFLVTALPQGGGELPLTYIYGITSTVWSKLRKNLFPQIFLDLYLQFSKPFKNDNKPTLMACRGGEALVSLSEVLGQKTGDLLPTLFVNEKGHSPSPLIEALIKALSSFIKGNDATKQWLSTWIGVQLVKISTSDNPDIKKIWMFLGSYLEPILLHIFCHMTHIPPSKIKGKLPDALGIIAIRFCTVCGEFFNENQRLIEERISHLKTTNSDLLSDNEFHNLFIPLSDSLLKMMGLSEMEHLPLPLFFKEIVFSNVKEMLPKFLSKQYSAISGNKLNDYKAREKLRTLLFDSKKIEDPIVKARIVNALHEKGILRTPNMFEDFYRTLWDITGTENLSTTFENLCSVLANDSVNALMNQFGISAQKILSPERNQFMKQTIDYLKARFELIWLEVIVQVIETTTEKSSLLKEAPRDQSKNPLLFNVIQRLFALVNGGLSTVPLKLQDIDKKSKGDKHLYLQEIRKIFAPLTNNLQALSGINPLSRLPLDGLPAAETIKNQLWTATRETLLPDLIASMYFDTKAWENQIQKSYEDLERCYHTTHAKWAVHVLAKYGTDFTKHYIATANDDLGEVLFNSLQEYLKATNDPKGKELLLAFASQKSSIVAMLGQNLRLLGESKDSQINALWPSLNIYLEAFIAKLFARLSLSIQEIESDNLELSYDIAIGMLTETAEYFKALNNVATKFGDENGHPIPGAVTLASFGSKLHDGVPLDPLSSEQEKQRIRMQGYFVPLTAKIFELAKLTIKDLPLPVPLRSLFGDLVVGKILPQVLMQSNLKVLEPQVRDSLMLTFVQRLYAALNVIESRPKDTIPEEAKKLTAKQKQLNDTCGAVVADLVKSIPDTMVQYVFMKEKVKNMSAQMIGEAIMPHISRWTILQMIDSVLFAGIPNFHPSKWEGKVGRETLIPRKAFRCPDGKLELKAVNNFKFVFPKTPAEILAAVMEKKIEAEKIRIALRDDFTLTISSQLAVKAWEFIKTLWESFQGQLNDLIEGVFPGTGPKIKAQLDRFFHKVFFDIIGAVVKFMSGPLITAIQFIISKVYINIRADEIIENLHSPSFEHLLYKCTDVLFDGLLQSQHNKAKRVVVPSPGKG